MITNERDNADLWYAIACGALLVVAAAIRFRDLGTTMFEDEIWVAELIRRGGWHPHSYATPPLFYAIGRAWSSIRGFSDVALREPPAIFGVALCGVPLFAPLPRLTRFTWAALLAFSSPLIFYSERLKQYTIEAFVAALLIVLFLRLRQSSSAFTIGAFFLAAALGVTTLHATIFVIGAMAFLCIRRPRMLAGLAIIIALWGTAYVGWIQTGPESARLHGDMDQFFAAGGRWVTSPSLFVTNTMHWVGQSLNLIRFWWLVLPILILIWLIRERNFVVPVLAILPPLAVVAASALRVYPYGEVRLMIFCFPALFLLIASALADAARRVPLLLLLLVPFLFAGIACDVYNETYMHISDLRPLYEMVVKGHQAGEAIYADPSSAAPLGYYFPNLGTDLRSIPLRTIAGPGWYVQRAATFDPRGAGVVLRSGYVIAAHSQ